MTIEELMESLGVTGDEAKNAITDYTNTATSGLVATNRALKAEKRTIQTKLDAMGGLDLESIQEALGVDDVDLDELPALINSVKASGEPTKDDPRVAELERKLAKTEKRAELAEANGEATKSKLTKRLGMNDLNLQASAAISAAKGSVDLLMPQVAGRVRTEIDEDGTIEHIVLAPNGEPMEDAKGNPATLSMLMDEFKTRESFAGAFEGPLPGTGSGKPGGFTTKKKWKDMDIDERSQLRASNPAMADRLKAEAA